MMRTIALAATALLFLFTACSGSDDDVAADPGGDPGGAPGGSLTPPA